MAAQVHTKDVTNNQVVELITTGRSATSVCPERRTDGRRTAMTTTTAELPTRDLAPEPGAPSKVTLGSIVRDYVTKVRGGDVGSLPAVLGLIVLVVVFTSLRGETFTNASSTSRT